MIRFGLCCIFRKEFIKFRRTTAKDLQAFHRNQQLEYIAERRFIPTSLFCFLHRAARWFSVLLRNSLHCILGVYRSRSLEMVGNQYWGGIGDKL